MAPVLDVLNCYLFDTAQFKKKEFVMADDPNDSAVLARYSLYCHVHDGIAYSATMIASGNKDTNCNRVHVRRTSGHFQRENSSMSV